MPSRTRPAPFPERQPSSWPLAAMLLLLLLVLALLPAGSRAEPVPRLDPNRATAAELESLPFIGAERAQAIIRFRQSHGPIRSAEQLLAVPEIGPQTLEAIRPYLLLGDEAPKVPGASVSVQAAIGTRPGDIVLLADGDLLPVLLQDLTAARTSIEMAMFLFKTGDAPDNRPRQVAEALIAAQRRGVTVTVCLERSERDQELDAANRATARLLRKKGVTVRFDRPEVTTHAKVVVIDRRLALLGSHNLTHAALGVNRELSLRVDSPALAAELGRYVQGLGL
ncbi:MAG: phospholipase D-like domain-containing protein [Thermodesulfobacteriota bacterium]